MTKLNLTIVFEKGNVVSFDALPENSIALDGYVQGPKIDGENRRYSFDHHSECLRLVTEATCKQVLLAIRLGLPINEETKVFVNDIDADTTLSVWLLQNPSRVWEDRVAALVEAIGLTDAHGPVMGVHPLHWNITPPPPWKKDAPPQSLTMLEGFLKLVDTYLDGTAKLEPESSREEIHSGYGWSARTGWVKVESKDGFTSFYKSGFVLGFLGQPAPHGTTMYTVAKASDLVVAPLGPGSKVRPVTSVEQLEDTILGVLAREEQAFNPEQSLAHTWGGSSSVGGSPRNPDGSSSRLNPEQVLSVFRRFVK